MLKIWWLSWPQPHNALWIDPSYMAHGPRMPSALCAKNVNHLLLSTMAFTFAYKALPFGDEPPTGQNPVIPNSLRACLAASAHFFSELEAHAFLLRADIAFETTLPDLLVVKLALVNPPTVSSILPLNTRVLAPLPLATFFVGTFIALFFIAAFIAAFIAGFSAAFIAAFMATTFMAAAFMEVAFMAAGFMAADLGRAMVEIARKSKGQEQK